jgi:hypothetical protein
VTIRDPLRDHHATPRIERGEASSVRSSLSPRAVMQYAAQHGRYWNPIGVGLLFSIMIAAVVMAVEYTDAGRMLVKAWKANTAEVVALRQDVAESRAENKATAAIVREIKEQLSVQGQGNATVRIVALEKNQPLIGQMLTELNGKRPNSSWPRAAKDDFRQPPDAPSPVFPLFTTDQQWAIKPE